jgi:hypothetical protein
MANLRKAVLATAMISTGLLSSTGMAFAAGDDGSSHDKAGAQSDDQGHTKQHGLANSKKVSPNVNPAVCGNNTPVNVLGVQVPFQDIAGGGSVLSHSDEGTNPGNSKSCTNPSAS